MLLRDLFENSSSEKRLIVVYGGRFQPFHKGHYHAYRFLCKKFGKGNVWIATSNKTNFDKKADDVSPFTFKEKVEIITGLHDIPPEHIVQCKNPTFKPVEVFKEYKGYKLVYVAAVGAKNRSRYADSHFYEPLPEDTTAENISDLLTLNEKKGYYISVPMGSEDISGTMVREKLLELSKHERDADEFKRYFKEKLGKFDKVLAELIMARLKEVK